jgi:ssDNA-binding Zn-finger/Zn-ribbon topoisomerase 1
MQPMEELDAHRCGKCGTVRSHFELAVKGGTTPCPTCNGRGGVEVEIVEWHPYGSTTVPEYLADWEECPDCGGTGNE